MNKITPAGKWALVAVAAVVLLAIGWEFGKQSAAPAPASTSATSTVTETGTPAAGKVVTIPGTNATTTTVRSTGGAKPTPVIKIVTPLSGEIWTIGQMNTISWSKEAGVSGQIELLDAQTYALVGVINSQTGPHQTSYTWPTRQVFLSRTNPLSKDINPGAYLIRVRFDGNNLGSITSAPITIAK